MQKLPVNKTALSIVKKLKEDGWKIAVASNAIRETVITALDAIGILGYIEYIVSNEDVKIDNCANALEGCCSLNWA